jgi:hypothetical protein
MPGWQFAHVHIPRTAGISIKSFFENVVGADKCRRFGSHEDYAELIRLKRDDLKETFFVSAHAPYWLLESRLKPQGRFIFTILREPMERELSAFYYIVRGGSEAQFATIKTFDDYLETIRSRPDLRNLQKRYLATGHQLSEAPPLEVLYSYAMSNNAYFTLEKIPALQEYLKGIFGASFIFAHLNKSASESRASIQQELLPRQLASLRSLISEDIELYSLAQRSGGMHLPDWRFSITQS